MVDWPAKSLIKSLTYPLLGVGRGQRSVLLIGAVLIDVGMPQLVIIACTTTSSSIILLLPFLSCCPSRSNLLFPPSLQRSTAPEASLIRVRPRVILRTDSRRISRSICASHLSNEPNCREALLSFPSASYALPHPRVGFPGSQS